MTAPGPLQPGTFDSPSVSVKAKAGAAMNTGATDVLLALFDKGTQAAGVFTFIYLAGVLGERVSYDLRKKMFNHLQELSRGGLRGDRAVHQGVGGVVRQYDQRHVEQQQVPEEAERLIRSRRERERR